MTIDGVEYTLIPSIELHRVLSMKHTPFPWNLRTNHVGTDGFLEARIPGKPYGQEVLGDDYFEDQPAQRMDDAAFIDKLTKLFHQ